MLYTNARPIAAATSPIALRTRAEARFRHCRNANTAPAPALQRLEEPLQKLEVLLKGSAAR